MMRSLLFLACAATLLTGCATQSIQSRKNERMDIYSALPPEQQQLIDQGKIKVGMPMDAVYIAWGKPSQVLAGESEKGAMTTWIYHGTTMEEYRYWNYRYQAYGNRVYAEPYLDFDYMPRDYVAAEVVFENGVVKSWRTLQ
jgi:hypothetical protein